MKSQNITCIILGNKNLGESDKVVHLYSEEFGKMRAIAKGARRITSKFTGHLETFNIAEASIYFGPRNIILTEIITTKNFKELRDNLDKLKNALIISEITNQIIFENQKIEGLIELIENSLHELNKSKKPELISQSYIIKLLDKIGVIPDFKTRKNGSALLRHGRLPKKYLKFLHFLKTKPIKHTEKITLTKEEESRIKSLIKDLVEYQIEKPLRSLSI